MKLNELLEYKQQLEVKKEKHKSLMDELSKREHEPTESDYELYRDYSEISNLLMSIEIELCRREEHLETKEISELESLAHDAYRQIRRMENYEWDVVETSSDENKQGFFAQIDFLEKLQSAANLEIERRSFLESQAS